MVKTKGQGITFKTPKNGKGRALTMPSIVMDKLQLHRKEQNAERTELGQAYVNCDLVFAAFDGSPWKSDSFTKLFRRTVKYAQLPETGPHTLRRTSATFMALQGVNPKVASSRLGHSTVRLTLDIYSEVLPDMQADAAQKMDCAIRSAIDAFDGNNGGRMAAETPRNEIPEPVTLDKALSREALTNGRERSRTSDLYSVNVALYP